ncbi:MAG: hypothetical protein ACOX47_01015 [Bacillota bacterium]|jgi:hypothetical protein
MLKDKILAGAIIGVLSSAVKLTVNYLGYLFGFSKVVFWQITASRFLEKNDLTTPAAYLIGGVADFTVSASIGIAFLYVLDFIGKENLWLRGVGLGLATWVFLFGTLLGQSEPNAIPQEPNGILVTLVAHFIYGIALFIFTGLYLKIVNSPAKESRGITSFAPQPARKVKVFYIKSEQEGQEETNHKIKRLKKPKKI